MKLGYLILSLVVLLVAVPVFADETVLTGDVEAGLRFVSGDNTGDDESAKFNEYDNRDEGLVGRFGLFAAKDGSYLKADGNESSAEATVGRFDHFRVSLYYNEFDHNFTYDAKTVFQGVGNDNLVLGPGLYRSTNPANWYSFDYVVERQQAGAKGEITLGSPFFLTFDVNRTEKDGQAPWGVNSTSNSGGSYFAEIPMPIEYVTKTATVQAGYRSKALTAAVDMTVSSFDNDNENLTLVSPSNSTFTIYPVSLAPDNDMMQIGGQLILRELPLSSTLALRGSRAKLESDADILGFSKFNGEVTYTTASAILRSRPTADLDTEVAYRYVDKDNDSDQINTGELNELFHYTKHNASVEAGYHLTKHNRVAAGYEFTKIDRAKEVRPDSEETKDNKVFVEWKNSSLDFLTAKLRYEYLDRNTDFPSVPAGSISLDYYRPFDNASKKQDTVRVMLDLAPLDGFDMGVEYKYVMTDYEDTLLGLTDQDRQELIVDANVKLPAKADLYAYVAYEKAKSEGDFFRGDSDPFAPDAGDYAWSLKRKDDSWSYGAKLMVPLFDEKLKLTAAFDYQRNDGEADFATNYTTVPEDIKNNYGDYEKKTFDLKAEYAISEDLDFIAGYLYEKYELDDIQYNDYLYVYGSGASASYLSGAYADPDYEAKVGYVALKYKF